MNNLTIEEKKQYIYQNIDNIKNHSLFIKVLETNKCKYTKNINGIFLNLNSLDENIIIDFFNIFFYKNDNKIQCDYLDKEINENFDKKEEINNNINQNKNNLVNNEKYLLKNYTKIDQKIISFSKNKF